MRTHWKILRKNERGATAVYAAVVLAVLVMFTALGVDVNYLYGVRNELHNAADAGALAGASVLFNDGGSLNRQAAIDEAERIATANKTGTENVTEIIKETGHWSFGDREFTAKENTTQVEWQERSFAELDADEDFINAVRVYTARSDTPSFFAKILGFDKFFVRTHAVAYIGFAGSLNPEELEQPIALCKAALTDADGSYSCNVARFISEGDDTGAWSNLSTDNCGSSGTNAAEVIDLVCETGNAVKVIFGQDIGMINGQVDSATSPFYDCWVSNSNKKKLNWQITLPVVECAGSDGMDIDNCLPLVGAVTVNVLWITEINNVANFDADGNPKNPASLENRYSDAPQEMSIYDYDSDDHPIEPPVQTWACDEDSGFECWKSFVDYFDIQDVSGPPAEGDNVAYDDLYKDRTIFFLPDCTMHEPKGVTGGDNFGILARIPKLVE